MPYKDKRKRLDLVIKWRKENPSYNKEWRKKNPELNKSYVAKAFLKYQARHKVNRAIRSGELIKLPCSICENTKSEAHHDDYSKSLDVKWFCRIHHEDYHHGSGVPLVE